MIFAGKDRLQGWKDIAAYLARDERTVKRWEKQRGLPVRRIPGAGRANVYVLVPEIEAWLADAESCGEERVAGESAQAEPAGPADSTDSLDTLDKDTPDKVGRAGWDERWDSEAREPALEFAEMSLDAAPHAWPRTKLHLLGRSAPAVAVCVFGLLSAALIVGAGRLASPLPPKPAAEGRPERTMYKSPAPGLDELYLQGVYCLEKRTPESLEHARRAFEQVVASDPGHAPAYAALANTYLLLREYSNMPSKDAYAMAKIAAGRAVALDPNLADAHTSLGFIDFFSDWDAASAAKEFTTAIQLNPNSALAHHWYGSMLTHEGLFPEAIEQLNLAQRIEPTSPSIVASKALAIGLAGRRSEAIAMLQTLLSTDRDAGSAHQALALLSLVDPRDIPLFLDESRRLAVYRNDRKVLDVMTAAQESFQNGGETIMWSTILAKEKQLQPQGKVDDRMAVAEAALGHDEQAIRDLDELVRERDPYAIGMRADPLLLPLHHKPEFEAVLAKAGLPPFPKGK